MSLAYKVLVQCPLTSSDSTHPPTLACTCIQLQASTLHMQCAAASSNTVCQRLAVVPQLLSHAPRKSQHTRSAAGTFAVELSRLPRRSSLLHRVAARCINTMHSPSVVHPITAYKDVTFWCSQYSRVFLHVRYARVCVCGWQAMPRAHFTRLPQFMRLPQPEGSVRHGMHTHFCS
jgi:hypothetical protein